MVFKLAVASIACLAAVTSCTGLATSSHPPTLYIAGDSTAAKDDGSPALLGWGEKIGQYLSIPVVNNAISGATARTFTEDGNCTCFETPSVVTC